MSTDSTHVCGLCRLPMEPGRGKRKKGFHSLRADGIPCLEIKKYGKALAKSVRDSPFGQRDFADPGRVAFLKASMFKLANRLTVRGGGGRFVA